MKIEKRNIESPALGCLVGEAFQTLLSQLAKALEEEGLDLTTSEYMVLRALYSEDGIQQCEIADMTGKDKASICRCVTQLRKKGLVDTESVSHKCLRVFLTDYARDIELKVMEVARKRHEALTGLVSQKELDMFSKVLLQIIETKKIENRKEK